MLLLQWLHILDYEGVGTCRTPPRIAFSRGQMLHLACSLCKGLAYIHHNRVMHGDLKPSNIVTRRTNDLDNRWHPMICDFGNAVLFSSRWRVGGGKCTKRRLCTLPYAAPESLMRGEVFSYPSDIWSSGLILAEAEHGQPIFYFANSVRFDWEQLMCLWQRRVCFPFEHLPSSPSKTFHSKIRSELFALCPERNRRLVHKALTELPTIGHIYGSAFRTFVGRHLRLDPAERATSSDLDSQCRASTSGPRRGDSDKTWGIF